MLKAWESTGELLALREQQAAAGLAVPAARSAARAALEIQFPPEASAAESVDAAQALRQQGPEAPEPETAREAAQRLPEEAQRLLLPAVPVQASAAQEESQ